ncbi:hypothetical protein FPOA_06625 [Fusarium poae]|jgi:hypothetical protein|uniref:Uncharacterized protein n=1 Tax=Fusarium poae TaxID=36050 RepID=A0A1B8AI56_FUSPO|nr:hypothetical protein FPOA_06625 [Fusarium poae]
MPDFDTTLHPPGQTHSPGVEDNENAEHQRAQTPAAPNPNSEDDPADQDNPVGQDEPGGQDNRVDDEGVDLDGRRDSTLPTSPTTAMVTLSSADMGQTCPQACPQA